MYSFFIVMMAYHTQQISSPTQVNDLLSGYGNQIIGILKKFFGDKPVEIYLYGSRARKNANFGSDIDLMVKYPEKAKPDLSGIREAFYESHIPYKVDLVGWNEAADELKRNVENEGILLWKN